MARDILEILIDAERATNLDVLISFWNEIANKKKSYTLVDLRTANILISEFCLKVDGEDIEKGKFYYALAQMRKRS